tara:strand:- start:61 stop:2658 length:2598 start_codon:yes stop_codon:yes gene_type:complete
MAASSTVTTGDIATAANYNNLRADVLSNSASHTHTGASDNGVKINSNDLQGTTLASTVVASSLTSVGTLTTLTVDNIIINGTNIGHTSDTDAIAIASNGVVTMNQIPVFSAGINVSGGSIAGTLSTAAQTNITSVGTLTALTSSGVVTANSGLVVDGAGDFALLTGSGTVDGSNRNESIGFTEANDGSGGSGIRWYDGSGNLKGSMYGSIPTSSYVTPVYIGSTGNINLDPAGTGVGIRTSTPQNWHANADDLVVYSTGNTGITLATNNQSSGRGTIYMSDGTASDAEKHAGYITYLHSDNTMYFGTNGNGTAAFYVNSSQDMFLSNNNLYDVGNAWNEWTSAGIKAVGTIWASADGTETIQFDNDGTAGRIKTSYFSGSYTPIRLHMNGADKFEFTTGGDIKFLGGSGTTVLTDGTYIRRDNATGILAVDSQGDVRINIDTNANGGSEFTIGGNASADDLLSVGEAGADAFKITPVGGTTASHFTVYGNATSGAADGRNGGVVAINANYYAQTSGIFYISARGTERLRMIADGRLGIGGIQPETVHTTYDDLVLKASGTTNEHVGITLMSGDTSSYGGIAFSDVAHTSDMPAGTILYSHSDNGMYFTVNGSGSSRLYLKSDKVSLNGTLLDDVGNAHNYWSGTTLYHYGTSGTQEIYFRNGGTGANCHTQLSMYYNGTDSSSDAFIRFGRTVGTDVYYDMGADNGGSYPVWAVKHGGFQSGATYIEVNGSDDYVKLKTGNTERFRIDTSGDTYTNDGTVHSLSDSRLKKEVYALNDGLSIIEKLRPVEFQYNGSTSMTPDDGSVHYGFLADEVQEIAPQYVKEVSENIGGVLVDDIKTMSTTMMIPMLIKSIQELSERVKTLES